MEWQNGRQLSRATTERDSTTEDVLDFAYDANGIRTRKTVTRNTYRPVQTYKVTFVADGKTVKTMNVTEGYTLKDSDYPAVPEKAGYTGAWQRYPSLVQSNVTVSATYTKITTYYTVTFVADGFTVKTMQVYSGYKLKDSDYPSVPEKLRYEGTWQKYTAAVTSNVTVQATYRKMLPLLVRFYADETLVKTMQVDYGYRLNDLDYPDVPPKTGFTGSWRKYTQRITSDQIIRANYTPIGIIDPVLPSTVDSEPTEEPWEPIEPNPNADPEEEPVAAEPGLSESDWTLASTETVTHEYLTQNGKVARETIWQDVGRTVLSTKTLDFFYDDSGRPFAFNYSVDGGIASTYYYILNLQGDVVQIIDANGVMQAEYVYSPWGEVISAEGDLAEINPLRYRGYYYDSETGFYYLQSRYYDPENHRFINADSFASTGQGFVGTNMFAYCNNKPIINSDPSGHALRSNLTAICDGGSGYLDRTKDVKRVLRENYEQAKRWGWELDGPFEFYDAVKDGGKWDYKLHPDGSEWIPRNGVFSVNGKKMTAEQLGNINYGFTGSVLGFPAPVLHMAGGFVAIKNSGINWEDWWYDFDSKEDAEMIQLGIDMEYLMTITGYSTDEGVDFFWK